MPPPITVEERDRWELFFPGEVFAYPTPGRMIAPVRRTLLGIRIMDIRTHRELRIGDRVNLLRIALDPNTDDVNWDAVLRPAAHPQHMVEGVAWDPYMFQTHADRPLFFPWITSPSASTPSRTKPWQTCCNVASASPTWRTPDSHTALIARVSAAPPPSVKSAPYATFVGPFWETSAL